MTFERTVIQHKVDAAPALAAEPLPDVLLIVAKNELLFFIAPLLELGNVGDRGRTRKQRQVGCIAPERLRRSSADQPWALIQSSIKSFHHLQHRVEGCLERLRCRFERQLSLGDAYCGAGRTEDAESATHAGIAVWAS